MTDEQKIEAWNKVADAWTNYCKDGPEAFDWDYESRTLMCNLTGQRVTYWYAAGN